MYKVQGDRRRIAVLQVPSDSFVNCVGYLFELLFGDTEAVSDRNHPIIEEHAEHAALVQNAIEFHQPQYLLAWFAMKRQADQGLPNLHDRARRKIVQGVEPDNNVLAEIAGAEPALRRDRLRGDQHLAEGSADDVVSDASLVVG